MNIQEQVQHKINFKTKPLGSLGQLEEIALQIGQIQNTINPEIKNPTMLVFAADHGLAEAGISAFPKEVTRQMVMNFLAGGAAINVFCKQNNMNIKVVDAGVDFNFEKAEGLIDVKIAYGTKNMLKEAAMSPAECKLALQRGAAMVEELFQNGTNLVGFGEMGIGNTAAAALLMSKYCNLPIDQCVGRGTGLDDAGLKRKVLTLEKVLSKHKDVNKTIEILSTFGGLEIAMICGAMLKAYELKMIILVDGFIVTSALLAAHSQNPAILKNCIFCHVSNEQGHKRMLDFFNASPLLNLGLRLGEGTGSALALPIIQAAVNFLNEMASFEDAGVSNKE